MAKDSEWTKKEIFGENVKEAFYCEDPETDKLIRDIIFLYRKIKNFKLKIENRYEDFKKSIINDLRADVKRRIKDIKKDYNNEVKLEQVFESSRADNELFFYLDTFFIDLKRIVEFSFRLIARFEGLGNIGKFKLENLMTQLTGKSKDQKSNFVKILIKKYPEYVKFILSNKKWIMSLNYKRTQSIHYKIFNKTGSFKIGYFWNSIKTLDDEPEIKFPEIPLFNKPIPKLIEEEINNLKQFMNRTLSLRQDLIKKRKII